MANGALSEFKVIEYTDFISGAFCTKLMADLGAEVIKVEPPTGDSARRSGPFPGNIPHQEKSGLFLYLNTSKMDVTLDLRKAAALKIFKELIKEADVLVENHQPSVMKNLGLDYTVLHEANPRLVMTSISPFGQSGPYRDYKSTNLISTHMGGFAYYTPGSVDDLEKESPLKAGGHQGHYIAGLMAALMTLSGVFSRNMTDVGQHIDLSEHEAVAFNLCRDLATYSCDQIIPGRLKSQVRAFGSFLPCKDGYIQLYTTDERQWRGLLEAMGNPEWANDERYRDPASRTANWDSLEPHLMEWTQERGKEVIYQVVQPRHAACAPVNNIAEAVRSQQLAARGFFVEVEHPDAGKLRYPGAPARFSETPFQVTHPAPRLGEHNEEILCQRLGYTLQELVRMRANGII